MSVRVPVEWRADVDQHAAAIRELLDSRPEILAELREGTEVGRCIGNWGLAVATNIFMASALGDSAALRALAWMETLEGFPGV